MGRVVLDAPNVLLVDKGLLHMTEDEKEAPALTWETADATAPENFP